MGLAITRGLTIMDTYNKEILSRYAQQKRLRDRQNKAGMDAARNKSISGVIKSARKAHKLQKSMDILGSAYVSPKPYVKKNYN